MLILDSTKWGYGEAAKEYTRLLLKTQNMVFGVPDRSLAQKSAAELIEVTVEYAASRSPSRSTWSLRVADVAGSRRARAVKQFASLRKRKGREIERRKRVYPSYPSWKTGQDVGRVDRTSVVG